MLAFRFICIPCLLFGVGHCANLTSRSLRSKRAALLAEVRASSTSDSISNALATTAIESSLAVTMEAMIKGGNGLEVQRLLSIESKVVHAFEASPKNEFGRLTPRVVRNVAFAFFAREHGWLITGLEHHGHSTDFSDVHEVNILKDMAPQLVEWLLEARQWGRGLSLSDVVVMLAVLERLILDESIGILKDAYEENAHELTDNLDEKSLAEVFISYLLHVMSKIPKMDAQKHKRFKELVAERQNATYMQVKTFGQDTILNFEYAHRNRANPFAARHYSFDDATQIVRDISFNYGKWSNHDCIDLKAGFEDLDVKGNGRVPLATLYSKGTIGTFKFEESMTYLRETGSLDESVPGAPQVIMANYMLGPSNCISVLSYYSVCCVNECEVIMSEIESRIRHPSASPDLLLGVVGNLSYPPKQMPGLTEKLQRIAKVDGGEVPLRGRLFAQWLHHAFPYECPYPNIVKNAGEVLTSDKGSRKDITSSKAERDAFVQNAAISDIEATSEMLWSDAEVLLLGEKWPRYITVLPKVVAVVLLLCVLATTVWNTLQGIVSLGDHPLSKGRHGKHDEIPLYA